LLLPVIAATAQTDLWLDTSTERKNLTDRNINLSTKGKIFL
jgi:hypothetical protein